MDATFSNLPCGIQIRMIARFAEVFATKIHLVAEARFEPTRALPPQTRTCLMCSNLGWFGSMFPLRCQRTAKHNQVSYRNSHAGRAHLMVGTVSTHYGEVVVEHLLRDPLHRSHRTTLEYRSVLEVSPSECLMQSNSWASSDPL